MFCRRCILNCPWCSRHPTRLECAQSTVESCSRPSMTRTWTIGCTPSILSLLAQFGKRKPGLPREMLKPGGRWLVTDFNLLLRNLTRCGKWRREKGRQKNPPNDQKKNQPCNSGTAGAVLACDVLNSLSSLTMCGMLHLEATRCFPCIAILQIYKVSCFLCAGLPF